jgi:hypothetical protein
MSRSYNAGDEKIQDSVHEELEAERKNLEDAFSSLEAEPVNGENFGTGDGSTTTFTLSNAYVEGSTRIYNAGSRTVSYTESDPANGEITFDSAPADTNQLIADYRKA